ncbi:MAG: protein kinase [Thermoanaerobaculia bacterium]
MTLSPGSRLGPYEVLAPIGAGGMGEVYRAKDARVDRAVALKVLPEEFFEDEERRARFGREAKLLASLNHPGIAVLYSFEEIPGSSPSSSRHLLAMELVEGEDLAQRISPGPLPLEESLSYAKQIAEALEAAHEKGIVHRDLKPANVKVAEHGRVKLLDFGLAKMFEGDGGPGSSPSVTHSPTLTARATAAGVILGTAAYMSPEQARGKPLDKRTDVWAFGCVLYEMLTGKRAFDGETVSDTLVSVLSKEPDYAALPEQTPAAVRKILRRCMQRDARLRLRDIGDARLDLEEPGAPGASGTFTFEENAAAPDPSVGRNASAMSTRGSKRFLYLSWAIAAAFAAAAGAAWVDREGRVTPIADQATSVVDPSLSPDGTRVVLEDKDSSLWVVDLRRGTRGRLTLDHEGANAYPVWSRDGSRVFFASNRSGDWDLYDVSAGGGPARRLLARRGNQFPASEAPDGTLLFMERAKGSAADLWALSPDGTVAPFLVSPASKVDAQFSPDGRAVAYVSDETGREEIYVRRLARPGDVVALSTEGGKEPRWSPDGKEIFYRRGDSFFAATLASTGPLAVGDSKKLFEIRAASGRSQLHGGYSVSPDGRRFLVLLLDRRAIPTQINVVLNWFEELKAKVPVR